MESVITAEVIENLLVLLTLFVGGIPIAFATALIVQVAKWAKLVNFSGPVTAERLAVVHSLALGAVWIALQFYPVYAPAVSIFVLGIYGALFSALVYTKVWAPFAKKLGFPTSTMDFQYSRYDDMETGAVMAAPTPFDPDNPDHQPAD